MGLASGNNLPQFDRWVKQRIRPWAELELYIAKQEPQQLLGVGRERRTEWRCCPAARAAKSEISRPAQSRPFRIAFNLRCSLMHCVDFSRASTSSNEPEEKRRGRAEQGPASEKWSSSARLAERHLASRSRFHTPSHHCRTMADDKYELIYHAGFPGRGEVSLPRVHVLLRSR